MEPNEELRCEQEVREMEERTKRRKEGWRDFWGGVGGAVLFLFFFLIWALMNGLIAQNMPTYTVQSKAVQISTDPFAFLSFGKAVVEWQQPTDSPIYQIVLVTPRGIGTVEVLKLVGGSVPSRYNCFEDIYVKDNYFYYTPFVIGEQHQLELEHLRRFIIRTSEDTYRIKSSPELGTQLKHDYDFIKDYSPSNTKERKGLGSYDWIIGN